MLDEPIDPVATCRHHFCKSGVLSPQKLGYRECCQCEWVVSEGRYQELRGVGEVDENAVCAMREG